MVARVKERHSGFVGFHPPDRNPRAVLYNFKMQIISNGVLFERVTA
jgi:hypothetical protein